ncbi:ion channel [Paraburkholderia sp. BL6665CI2N2]|uniref:potassium channel family protein n=1 Tax=Paraburkholderia sp. BL6665CI2N2 TaxID=1938806 RepID=UPI0010653F79|nr:potassium channel family protein [Paraburkholderia sp. BL6665CI2N2]TDY16920.1 ion channel [Paraburkholderia sp. BL6665CI2N2]
MPAFAKNTRREAFVGVVFALSLVIMPWVYELLWYAHPDYFRVQAGVNVLPTELYSIAGEYSAYADGPSLPPMTLQSEQDDAANKILSIYRQFQATSVMLSTKRVELKKRQIGVQEEYKSFEASQWNQYEQFVAKKGLEFQPEIQHLTGAMHLILKQAGVAVPEQLPTGPLAVAYANLNVELARVQFKLTTAELDARVYGMGHLTDFQKLAPQQEYLKHYHEVETLEKEIFALQESTNKFHGQLYDAFVAYRNAALETLGYWDFFYFSVGAATTATFGDIAPNSKVVRILVCLQVFASIAGTGFVMSRLTRDRPTKPPAEKTP